MNYSFSECYRILEITEDCEWGTLRKKYKKLIQKSHPDRFPSNSPEHQKAEINITKYNTAYKQLADYYQLHQTLPNRSKPKPEIQTAEPKPHKPRKKRPGVHHESFDTKKQKQNTKTSFKKTSFSIALVGATIYFYFLLNSKSPDPLPSPALESTEKSEIEKPIQINQNLITPHPTEAPDNELYFTTGSSLGEVISIQGEPSRVAGSIWYYGKSSVTFTKGVVSDWFRHPDDPIHVRVTYSPALQFQQKKTLLKHKLETSTPQKPYWER